MNIFIKKCNNVNDFEEIYKIVCMFIFRCCDVVICFGRGEDFGGDIYVRCSFWCGY